MSSNAGSITLKPLLELRNINKSYGNIVALYDENFQVGHNEIIGLIGDNGAGKSTLIKIITGVVNQDRGQIFWKGNNISSHSVKQSRELGIETVYQDKALGEQQNIWRNMFMGRELTYKTGFVKRRESKSRAIKILKELGFTKSDFLNPVLNVGSLSGGEKQGIAIARALYFESELIILDEPTNNLSITETNKVLNFVQEIKNHGNSCIIISHNIYHVYPVADKFVVLDRGKIVSEFLKNKISLDDLVSHLKHIAEHGRD